MTSMQMASLTAVDQSLSGSASGIFSTFRYFGSIISSTLIGIMSGFQSLFIVLMGAGILGFLLSQRVKTKSIPHHLGILPNDSLRSMSI